MVSYLEIEISSNINISDAIYITSDRPVTVFAMNVNQYSTGGMLVLPKQSLASNYLVATTPYDDDLSGLLIIPTESGTEVTLYFPDKTSQSVKLDYGKTYQLERSGLSGTYIEADKPIAVFAGEKCANLPDPGNYSCDHIIEQMPPIEALDTVYVTARTEPRSNFGLLIVAANDSTYVTINEIHSMSLYSFQMNRHDTIYKTFGNDIPYVSVTADKPVFVTQYGVSTTVDNLGQGDASMFVVPGVKHFLNNYRFVVPDGYDTNKVMIVYNITDGNDPRTGLNHNRVTEYIAEMTSVQVWQDIFGVCYLEVEAGVHQLENSEAMFGAVLYGQARNKEYAWNLGMYMWTV
ncbi:uncharacterized protein LOC123528047 [Mercenaria mercenaria]|uniref:uncharacterized protein LOC123528047 n=1 Tax=Mercenaria mercenaria TaxID=6596 RepID=UPI00234E563A|nr:uncharacterized protein LOC123528047 [Mercenaria mercenaria]